jgi:hypothetical protein
MKKYFGLLSLFIISTMLFSGAMTAFAQDGKDGGGGLIIVPPPNNPPGQPGPNNPPGQRDPNNPPPGQPDPNNPPAQPDPNSGQGEPSEPSGETPPGAGQSDPNGGSAGADADGDGTPDDQDNCPTVAGLLENQGCPDDPFVPPVLPTLDCYATPAGDYQVWVRPESNETQPAIGHLNPGTIYEAIGFVIAPDGTRWLVVMIYEGSTGVVGYVADWAVLTSNCPVLGPIGPIEAVYTTEPAEGEGGTSHHFVVTSDIVFGDCNENGLDDLNEYPVPDCIEDLIDDSDEPVPATIRLQMIFMRAGRDCNNNGIDDLDEFLPPDCYGKLTTAGGTSQAPMPPDDDDDPYPPGIDQADADAMTLSCGNKGWILLFDENGVATGYQCGTAPEESQAGRQPATVFVVEMMGGDCNNDGVDDLDEFFPPDCYGKKLTTAGGTSAASAPTHDPQGNPYPPGIDQADADAMTLSCGDKGWVILFDDNGVATGYQCGTRTEDAESQVFDLPWLTPLRMVVMPIGPDGIGDLVVLETGTAVGGSSFQFVCNALVSNLPDYAQVFAKEQFCRTKPH